jgi:hypothetical protein
MRSFQKNTEAAVLWVGGGGVFTTTELHRVSTASFRLSKYTGEEAKHP